MESLKLLLIGASVFQRNSQGKLTSKQLVVDYVQGFTQYFKQVIWATSLFKGKTHTQTVVDEEIVIPCILNGRPNGLLSDYLKLRRLIDPNTVIFLHLPNPWLTPIILALRRKAKAVFVYVASDYIMHSEISKRTRGRIYSMLYKFIYELSIRLADGVIVRGETNLKRARMLNRNIIKTMPIGLTTVLYRREKVPLSGDSVHLLYVGKLVEGKGVEVLLQAFTGLCKRLPAKDISLTIVGTGPEEENLKALCLSMGISEKARFTGFVDDKYELSRLYEESDILVVPSTHPEGVPRVIDESLLHGMLVVASAVGGVPEEFGSNGQVTLVPPGDVRALEITLYDLITRSASPTINAMQKIHEQSLNASQQHACFMLKWTKYDPNDFYENPVYIHRVKSTSHLRCVKDPHIVGLLSDRIVLELGCGSTPQDHLGREYIGLDISLEALKKGTGRGHRIKADATKIPLRDNTVDAVLTIATLEHAPQPILLLNGIIRVLSPGGIVVHQDAWNVPTWRPLGLKVKRYSELTFGHKLLKMICPLLETLPIRILRIMPPRLLRELRFKLGYYSIEFRRLNPNYSLPGVSDADACVSIDSHAVALFYKTHGFKLIRPKDGFLNRILHRGALIAERLL